LQPPRTVNGIFYYIDCLTNSLFMETNESLLSDLEQGIAHEPAGAGIRFANYLIDLIGFYVMMLVVGLVIGLMQLQNEAYYEDETLSGSKVGDYLISYGLYLLYYTIFEGATKGRSLGKLITGTVAIQEDGNPVTWNKALMRSLSRLVPFEPFSALGRKPWHDTWTQTMVVKRNA
jgi:uncharacterized RDD family membrane protein YckC